MPVERFQVPGKGQAFRTAPLAITKDQAYEVENLLTHQPGKVAVRGPFGPAHEAFNPAVGTAGRMRFDNSILLARNTTGRRVTLDPATGTVGSSAVALAIGQVPFSRSARLGSYSYAIGGFNSVDIPNQPGGILRWDGTTTAPVMQANCPYQAWDVCAHLERLFVGGGRTPAAGANPGTAFEGNKLHWSDIGGPTAGTLAQWQDDVSGLVNEIQVGSPGDTIRALASMARQLVIFKEDSIWVALGDSPSTFTVRRISNQMGCTSPDSVVVTDEVCLFVSTEGYLTMYDGARFTRLGGPRHATTPASVYSSTSARSPHVARLANDYYLVSSDDASPSIIAELWLFHLPTEAWSKVTATTGVVSIAAARRQLLVTEVGSAAIFDGQHVRMLDKLTSDDAEDLTGRDSLAASASTYEIIAAKLTTRLARLAEPTNRAVVRSAYVDHKTQSDALGSSLPSWEVSIKDAAGTTKGSFEVAAEPTSIALRATQAQDLHVEAPEAMVTLEYSSPGAPGLTTAAEIHDVWLEYEPAQRF